MRVISHVSRMVADLEWDEEDLGRAIKVDPRTARKLINDENWELRRETLYRLLLLGFEHGLDRGVFDVRPHELWETFRSAQASIFREDLTWDTSVEKSIRRFLQHLDCTPNLAYAGDDEEEIRRTIRTRNCIFIGSPKANRATEVALALLSGTRPFDSAVDNRGAMLFQLLGKSPQHKSGGSAFLGESTWCGIVVRDPGKDHPHRVKVDWLSDEELRGPARTGHDAAAIVVCRKPLGTVSDVTTVAICGYTGLATQEAAEQLIQGNPPISPEQLTSSENIGIVYTFQFKKRAYSGPRNLDGLKVPVPKSGRWHPPW